MHRFKPFAPLSLAFILSVALIAAPAQAQARRWHRPAVPSRPAVLVPDADVVAAVQKNLGKVPGVAADQIRVESEQDVVHLTGAVDDLRTKLQIQAAAQRVRGVRAVVNDIEVKRSGRSDADIRGDIGQKLAAVPALKKANLRVEVNDGAVRLEGTVDTRRQRRRAAEIASAVSGVRDLENRIDLRQRRTLSDEQLRDAIRGRLRWDRRVNDVLVRVQVYEGIAILSGTVGSAAEKQRAIDIARHSGARSVEATALRLYANLPTPAAPQAK